MNKRLLLLILLVVTPLLTTAQKTLYNTTNTVVSISDLENTLYEKDSIANAFFIYEKGYSRVENGKKYNILTDYEAKIKICNQKGFNKATVEILLYKNKNKKEEFSNLIAYTHNLENGSIVSTKINKENIYKEEYSENYTLIKFTFPNLKSGSVITYKYQIESPFIFKFNGWDFQDDIPKMYSEYIADIPGNYIYHSKLNGPLKLDLNTSEIIKDCLTIAGGVGGKSECSHNIYAMKNIPAFKEEKHMTAKQNYFSRIEYELAEIRYFDGSITKHTKSWHFVDKDLKQDPNIGGQLKKITAVKNVLPLTIQSMSNDITKAKAIYYYITKHYKWNNKNKIFKDTSINDILKEKTGDTGSLNILLHNVLKQQGFNVHSVLLSTRSNGYATKLYPVISDFNYLIVQLSLEKNSYLLDATESTLAFGQVPFRCLNQYGRLLDFNNGSSWIDIHPKKHSSHFFKEELSFNPELKLEGKASHVFSEYHAHFNRKKIEQLGKEEFLNNIKNKNSQVLINKVKIENLEENDKPLRLEFDFTTDVSELDGIVYIQPFTRKFFEENPFKLDQRTYPIDFGYKDSYTYMISLELPEDYTFIDLPKNSGHSIPNKLGRVDTSYQQNGQRLTIMHRVIFNSAYYPTEYYPILKKFFELILEVENDSLITIKKIS
ncbi:DUF3857 domain-containing protein [Aquimarina pacifica]|uniref:DUF3857 domain-containing protein n=1 Tax=Aquimarina pacifica TaxID=1296415 RepID=UPI0004720DBA|nr:DUF3857 domain-containing protein [Aquimarina pacifica]